MKKDYFKNKVVIITGSSRGIGKSLAKELCKLGAGVVINGRDQERLEKLREEMHSQKYDVLAVQADVTQTSEADALIKKTVEYFGRIDMLVNMAGISMNAQFKDLEAVVFRQTMEINYLGSVFPTRAALPYIKESSGSILFISSVSGLIGLPNFSAYCASKMSLTALAESLRLELIETGVHIGITYVSFTRNELGKLILDPKGRRMKKPEFDDQMRYDSNLTVSRKIIRQLSKRKFRYNYSFYGRLILFMKSICPGFLFRVLAIARKRRMFQGKRKPVQTDS